MPNTSATHCGPPCDDAVPAEKENAVDLITNATATDEAHRAARVAALPVGSFEQHGDHLPLATDTVVACLIAARLADTYELSYAAPDHLVFPRT